MVEIDSKQDCLILKDEERFVDDVKQLIDQTLAIGPFIPELTSDTWQRVQKEGKSLLAVVASFGKEVEMRHVIDTAVKARSSPVIVSYAPIPRDMKLARNWGIEG